MKPTALALLVTTCCACATHEAEWSAGSSPAAARRATAQASGTAPAPAASSPEHAWLQQLVGEWSFTCRATMADGAEPFHMEGTESVRAVGGLWIVAEGRANVGGQPMQSLMSLGYQADEQAFIGTWLDSMQPQMWSYRGTLDAGRTTLTLETQGPSFDDPGRTSRYRDAIELKDKDHKVLTSSVQGADGVWTTFMRAEYTRRN